MSDFELSGNLTIDSIKQANPNFVAPLNPNDFTNVNQLYTRLQNRGSLTLRDAVLTLPDNSGKVFLALHKLTLINSIVVVNASLVTVICNEYDHQKSFIRSFNERNSTASDGADGTSPGADGKMGTAGEHSGNCYFFCTDVVRTSGGLINIDLSGKWGGSGGNGAAGAKGAKGGNGRNCASGPFDCRSGCGDGHKGGRGGNGGNGGNGGDGGNGGRFELRLHGFNTPGDRMFSFTSEGGKAGYGGIGNVGGLGGDGGDAGRSGCTNCNGVCRKGAAGDAGSHGSNGAAGKAGEKSHLVNATFDLDHIKTFLAVWNGTKQVSDITIEISNGLAAMAGKLEKEVASI
jgi:hypothetical protein